MQSPADNAQRYYDSHSDDYVSKWSRIDAEPDRPAHVYRKEIIRALIEMARVEPGDEVVEIGCGTGLVLRELLERTKPIWGTDISLAMLQRAQEELSSVASVEIVDGFDEAPSRPSNTVLQGRPDVLLVHGDLLGLELPAGRFDRILSMEVLRYIADLDAALRSVRSAMDERTVFAFTVTNPWSASLFPVKYELRRRLGRVDADAELLQHFVTERGIRRAVARNGLELLELRKLNLLTFNPLVSPLARDRCGAERLVAIDRKLERVPLLNKAFDTLLLSVRRLG
jgi:predicted TPR repeat methyltransferase